MYEIKEAFLLLTGNSPFQSDLLNMLINFWQMSYLIDVGWPLNLQTYFIFIVGPNWCPPSQDLCSATYFLSLHVWMALVIYMFARSSPTDNKRPGLYSVSVSQMQLMEDNYVLLLIDKINKNLLWWSRLTVNEQWVTSSGSVKIFQKVSLELLNNERRFVIPNFLFVTICWVS